MSKMPPVLGCVEDEPDVKDFQYEEVMGAVKPDWKTGFDNEIKYGPLREDHQGYSLGCVSFGTTNDMEMSVKKILGKDLNFSQRFIYSQIHLRNGGASPRTAYKLLNKQGVCEDQYMHTPVGRSISEAQMRDELGLEEARKHAAEWKIGAYRSIAPSNTDALAQAIFENGGCGGGYKSFGVNMGHFVFFPAYGMHKGYRGFKFHDSYTPHDKWIIFNKGKFYLDNIRGHQVQLFSMWTAEAGAWDAKDMATKLVRKKKGKQVFLLLNGRRYWIVDEQSLTDLSVGGLLGSSVTTTAEGWAAVEEVDDLPGVFEGDIIGKKNFRQLLKELFGRVQ